MLHDDIVIMKANLNPSTLEYLQRNRLFKQDTLISDL